MSIARVWTATCRGCDPWIRVVRRPGTDVPVEQVLHETHCDVFPTLTPADREALSGD